MPISSSAVSAEKRRAFRVQAKGEVTVEVHENAAKDKDFLTIGPALPSQGKKLYKRSHSTVTAGNIQKNDAQSSPEILTLHSHQNGNILISRTQKERERHPDRINLDRRGLTMLPLIEGEPKLRLLSMQHNLINNLDGLREQNFAFLVFLDMYDNQLEKIYCLEKLDNLRVLLIGKNRIKKIEGLQNSSKIEVLDLHGNQIQNVSGLSNLGDLKVLNLAGNQIKSIGHGDFEGLSNLQELNLRRNRIKKLLGFGETPNLQKLFLSNNDIQTINDMSSVIKSSNLKEISVDNNPVFLTGDCVSFLVSYLPVLHVLNSMQVTEQVRKAAMAWRRNKESTNVTFMDLASDANLNGRREEVISNARTNWELLRSQTKTLTANSSGSIPKVAKLQPDADFILTSLTKPEAKIKAKTKNLSTKVPPLPVEKKGYVRTTSQDTDNSSSNSGSDLFRLPPILVPIINKIEQRSESPSPKLSDSLSSIGPNVDSSVSSLNSTHSGASSETSSVEYDDSDEADDCDDDAAIEKAAENIEDQAVNQKTCEPLNLEEKPACDLEKTSSDSASNLSTNTTASNATNMISSSDASIQSKNSSKNSRSIRSAANLRSVQTKVVSRAATAKPKKQSSPNVGNNVSNSRDREQGGDYLIEICGRYLNVYGHGALRFIDKPWSHSKANDVYTINFNYANFNGITTVLSKIKQRFPNAENFIFKETNIQHLGQLNALAEIQGLSSLFIGEEGNPVATKNWKSYAIFRLSHWGLRIINGVEITEEDIKAANEEYQSLSDLVLWSLPDVLLQPLLVRLHIDVSQTENEQGAKRWLLNADPALKSVVSREALQWKKGSIPQEDLAARQRAKNYIGSIIDHMCHAVNKLRMLDEKWPSILHEIVRNTLLDYSQLDMYMKEKIQELK